MRRAADGDAGPRHRLRPGGHGLGRAAARRGGGRHRLSGRPRRPRLRPWRQRDRRHARLLHAFTANLVSAAVRLVPLGQTAGLRIQAALAPALAALAAETAAATLDDIGGACFRSDIAAFRHETQYTRLFRT
ncbi:MAG: urease accessory UreF family protein [Acetobacteraceae bacterium]